MTPEPPKRLFDDNVAAEVRDFLDGRGGLAVAVVVGLIVLYLVVTFGYAAVTAVTEFITNL